MSVARPFTTLTAAFLAWKGLLLALALWTAAAGGAYDTSTTLSLISDNHLPGVASLAAAGGLGRPALDTEALSAGAGAATAVATDAAPQPSGEHVAFSSPLLVTCLTRWDAIYFTQIARRGYRFEQEYAFGSGLPFIVRAVTTRAVDVLSWWNFPLASDEEARLARDHDDGNEDPEPSLQPRLSPWTYALSGIAIAHLAHLSAVLLLHRLTLVLWPGDPQLALTSALLHILSPAGLFLSAPYAEGLFALFSFAGYLLFAIGTRSTPAWRLWHLSAAGLLFGIATTFRSNGLLSGVLFAGELLATLVDLGTRPRPLSLGIEPIVRVTAPIVGGLLTAMGSFLPQLAAYQRFCSDGSDGLRPWCVGLVPSIYAFVQSHYWNTGFLRYWTLGNLPLFLLAAPVLTILVRSGAAYARPVTSSKSQGKLDAGAVAVVAPVHRNLLRWMAVAQILLAVLAATSYHVQIITRLASGYPIWYWWVARKLSDGKSSAEGKTIVKFMVMYALIQGVLFAAFLPPA